MTAAVLAVDGGNSKTDVALVARDGTLLAALRGPTTSHQAVGLEAGMDRLVRQVEDAARRAGLDPTARPLASIGVLATAGADYRRDIRLLERSLAATRLAGQVVVVNDAVAALWAGATAGWGIALICGQGINGAAIGPDGRTARFDAVGDISGDWGGGTSVGMAGLAAAVRARDGRGPQTSLERLVPAHFGLVRPSAVTRALYEERIVIGRIGELSPVVFRAASDGDAVARSIVDRLADELVTMAVALARRAAIVRTSIEVVLAGGVFRTDDARFFDRIDAGIRATIRHARLVRLDVPPVAGAALEGLDRLGFADETVREAARTHVRAALAGWAPGD
ncbi:MAG TPA: BadF/BadG/BcrA/BcrD ATPase family protein [Candidatus Limnocylindrales bacterium]|nr:BadF/BadG/BcrA/BcrD ATPase family protein [Candidatus Limnocylindrales bacterium]